MVWRPLSANDYRVEVAVELGSGPLRPVCLWTGRGGGPVRRRFGEMAGAGCRGTCRGATGLGARVSRPGPFVGGEGFSMYMLSTCGCVAIFCVSPSKLGDTWESRRGQSELRSPGTTCVVDEILTLSKTRLNKGNLVANAGREQALDGHPRASSDNPWGKSRHCPPPCPIGGQWAGARYTTVSQKPYLARLQGTCSLEHEPYDADTLAR